jgi:hypothetical protein
LIRTPNLHYDESDSEFSSDSEDSSEEEEDDDVED